MRIYVGGLKLPPGFILGATSLKLCLVDFVSSMCGYIETVPLPFSIHASIIVVVFHKTATQHQLSTHLLLESARHFHQKLAPTAVVAGVVVV